MDLKSNYWQSLIFSIDFWDFKFKFNQYVFAYTRHIDFCLIKDIAYSINNIIQRIRLYRLIINLIG